jgi:hypothetical protein
LFCYFFLLAPLFVSFKGTLAHPICFFLLSSSIASLHCSLNLFLLYEHTKIFLTRCRAHSHISFPPCCSRYLCSCSSFLPLQLLLRSAHYLTHPPYCLLIFVSLLIVPSLQTPSPALK